tara:strand:- start:302 stop:724 length:423 start_codon:yes stop_codon:yes gene_type:complete
MINYRPILALIIISSGFLISISVVFLDMLGPDIPLPRKSISEILKSSSTSFEISIKKNANMTTTRKLAELYLDQENLVHGYSNLDFNTNLSDIESGNFTFLSALCYGKSENDCIYFNAYLKSSDYGETWEIGFLERNTNI